jgi:type III restriction enzyme
MVREEAASFMTMRASSSVHYDLVGKIVAETGLTRKAVTKIMIRLEKVIFDQFGDNPEEYIIRASTYQRAESYGNYRTHNLQ